MNETSELAQNLNSEELAILAGLLAAERDRLLVEIRHTVHRKYRDQLRERITIVLNLLDRWPSAN
jgi:hypothetical protein